MMNIITRFEIENLLRRWQSGELTHQQIYDWANDRFATSKWDAEDEIVNEVLAELDNLNMNLTTPKDIPHLLHLLTISPGQIEKLVAQQEAYLESIDIEARKAALARDLFYAPFCK